MFCYLFFINVNNTTEQKITIIFPVCRYALVDFGLAQGTADTQIELLKVVKHRASQKGGGSTGKQDTTQRGKAQLKIPPKATTASTLLPQPPQQSTNIQPSSSSSSTTTSSSASRKIMVKKARSATTAITTSTSRTKHTKVSALNI